MEYSNLELEKYIHERHDYITLDSLERSFSEGQRRIYKTSFSRKYK